MKKTIFHKAEKYWDRIFYILTLAALGYFFFVENTHQMVFWGIMAIIAKINIEKE